MKTASAYILYTPLSLSLYVDILGGSLNQRKDYLTGGFDPDRTLFPIQLCPRLVVHDFDNIVPSGDHSQDLIDCRWYIGCNESGERITSSTTGFSLGTCGVLTVSRNVEPSLPLNLYFSCAYVDPRTNKPYRKNYLVTLTSVLGTDLALSIEIDAAKKMAVSPFLINKKRTINAIFRNGEMVIPDELATFRWDVLDGGLWRAITDDDIFYESGQGSKSLTIDRSYIDKEFIRVVASPKSNSQVSVEAHTKVFRWYGQWSERVAIVRGKFVRPSTRDIEVCCIVDSSKGVISSPEQYYDITHVLTTDEKDSPLNVIGYGESVIVPASIVGKDPNVLPIFGCEVKERTALRACCIEGKTVTLNGVVMTMSVSDK